MSFKLQRYEERPATIQEHRELRDEVKRLRAALERTLPVLAAAAAGAPASIAAGDIYRETRAALSHPKGTE